MNSAPSLRVRAGSALVLILGLSAASIVVSPLSASAVPLTYTVTTNADSGVGSLRDAIAQANGNVGFADTIVFAPGLGTILPLTGMVITEALTIDGGTPHQVIAGGAAANYALMLITAGSAAQEFTFRNLTFDGTQAIAGFDGQMIATSGGPFSPHAITIDTVDAHDMTGHEGQVLHTFNTDATGTVTVTNSTFTNNISAFNNGGGSFYFRGVGGGISISGSTFTGNTAVNDGGAIFIDGNGGGLPSLSVTSSTFSGNHANGAATGRGGAIFANVLKGLTIADSSFTGNGANQGGGALAVLGLSAGASTASITRSTFSGNTGANNGGAILFGATPGVTAAGGITVSNSTFFGNSVNAVGNGRSIAFTRQVHLAPSAAMNAPISIVNSTFDESTGAGHYAIWLEDLSGPATLSVANSTVLGGLDILNLDSTSATVDHSIMWAAAPAGPEGLHADTAVGAAKISVRWSLLSGPTQIYFTSVAGNQFSVAAHGLAALANNGGPTQTRIPTASSAALNAGDPAFGAVPAFDQRGAGFVRRVGVIDIGAVEGAAIAAASGAQLPATGGRVDPASPFGAVFLILLGLALLLTSVRLRRA